MTDALARARSLRNAPNCQDERRRAHIKARFISQVEYIGTGTTHHQLQLTVNAFEIPAKLLNVLTPLEIADSDSSGIGQNVRYKHHATGVQAIVRFRRSWSICGFNYNLCLYLVGIIPIDGGTAL